MNCCLAVSLLGLNGRGAGTRINSAFDPQVERARLSTCSVRDCKLPPLLSDMVEVSLFLMYLITSFEMRSTSKSGDVCFCLLRLDVISIPNESGADEIVCGRSNTAGFEICDAADSMTISSSSSSESFGLFSIDRSIEKGTTEA